MIKKKDFEGALEVVNEMKMGGNLGEEVVRKVELMLVRVEWVVGGRLCCFVVFG